MVLSLINTNNQDECSICLAPIKKNKKNELNCNHIFHNNCINEWLKKNNSCPLCRTQIKQKLPKPSVRINADGINIYLPRHYIQVNRNRNIKKIYIILFILICISHFGATIYNLYESIITSNYINDYIKHLNSTELGNHNHNTNDQYVLVGFDMFYYFFFIIINYYLLNKKQFIEHCTNNCCSKIGLGIFLAILYMTNFIIRFSFNGNLNSYLNDSIFNFDKSYASKLNDSLVIYGSLLGVKIVVGLFLIFKYNN